ncbi:hypothetical protein VII00023_22249 [Vibrio ichthyoenteri ATCC 700023]|uniref:Uncharacterized protein n=1 Tax=Vibrio ichthyoenteri ATCC 700023 TaxID=870968 RepID=F9RZF7_9VIBR|nr:hypothetical protein VII00023_22249 [Vibrio ichthyoenteri ATCC 700023]
MVLTLKVDSNSVAYQPVSYLMVCCAQTGGTKAA